MKNFLLKYSISIFIIGILFSPLFVLAQNSSICSPRGYTLLTINGIFTDKEGAAENKRALQDKLLEFYPNFIFNNEPFTVDFLYNPTHGKIIDALDAINQKYFEQNSLNIQDSDFAQMLIDASAKVKTQKLLLVGHSQGNFYANTFYDAVADEPGGVPSQSISVYGVATPSNHVAGNGFYITSETDKMIADFVSSAPLTNTLKPNSHINFKVSDGDSLGHSLSKIYLPYEGARIISDIKSSLNKLQTNDEKEPGDLCLDPPKLTLTQKVQGVALASADFVINNTNKAGVYIADSAYSTGATIGSFIHNTGLAINNTVSELLANAIDSLPDTSSITTILPDVSELAKNNSPQRKEITTNENITDEAIITTKPVSDLNEKENIVNNVLEPIIPITPIVPNVVFHGGGGGGGGGSPPIADTTAPIISLIAADSINVIKGMTYTDAGATANDEKDGVRTVITTGNVDIKTIGTYTLTYTASDLSNNISTTTRTVNVVAPAPDTTAPVITLLGNNPEVVIKNSVYTDSGATVSDNIDVGLTVTATGIADVNTAVIGNYTITYSATDLSGNVATKTRTVTIATYKYISKYSFGTNNGDGNNWQVWSFNGSNVYDWSDTYVDNYLREQFKIQSYPGGFWCSQCLQRGIFNHDPQKGFELIDKTISGLENNPQNSMKSVIHDISLQWDSTGYAYTIFHDSIIDFTGRTDVSNVNENMWTGWDGSFNNFQTFPSGDWQGIVYASPLNRTGGASMIMQPFPVYKNQSVPTVPTLSFPNKGSHTVGGINPTRGRTNLTPFTFQVVYTDGNNNTPQNVKLHVTNITSGVSLSEIEMQKISQGADVLSDGSFVNGESYITNNILYDTGDYSYYFTANDNAGNLIRIPDNDALNFGVIPSTYKYISKYKFGTDNGDGNNWQVWSFNGSNVYDWSDTYIDNYLREQFKIQAYVGAAWCSQCLQRGIFNHDPQKGFEATDLISKTGLESNPQNNVNGKTYDVTMQWDSTGYTYTISHDSIIDFTGRTDVVNMNNNLWVGWDGSFNNFQTFPSGDWQGVVFNSPLNRTGGASMIMQPYPVYVYSGPVLSKQKVITTFNFASLAPNVIGVVDEVNHTVALTVPFGIDVTALVPTITISSGASINPNNNVAQNFTSPVTYTVTAENGSTQNYIVTVSVTP